MFVRSSRTHSAVCVSAYRSASLSAPASLSLHGGFIKSGDGVGRVDCSLAQLIRVVYIFHHITINGTVNHFGFSVRRCRLLLAFCYRFFLFWQSGFSLAIYVLGMRVPALQIPRPENAGTYRQHSSNNHHFGFAVHSYSPQHVSALS